MAVLKDRMDYEGPSWDAQSNKDGINKKLIKQPIIDGASK
jgi:hypothetical protein